MDILKGKVNPLFLQDKSQPFQDFILIEPVKESSSAEVEKLRDEFKKKIED